MMSCALLFIAEQQEKERYRTNLSAAGHRLREQHADSGRWRRWRRGNDGLQGNYHPDYNPTSHRELQSSVPGIHLCPTV